MGDDVGVVFFQIAFVDALAHAFSGNGLHVGSLADHQIVAHDVLRQVAGMGQFHGELFAALVDGEFLGGVGHLVSRVDSYRALGGEDGGAGEGQQGYRYSFRKHHESPWQGFINCETA
ncbi:hypothetical protein D3C73_1369430 [compost metagenome]